MKDCLKCKNLDTSDIPNLFCKLNCELVNETEFRYCPKDPKSVVEFIEKLERLHKEKDKEIEKWKLNWKIADNQCNEYEEQIKVLRVSQSSTHKTLMQTDEALRKTEKLLKDNTNQLCEKIRTFIINHNGLIYGFIANSEICEFLNQIKRGKK